MNEAHADSSAPGVAGLPPQTERQGQGLPAAPNPSSEDLPAGLTQAALRREPPGEGWSRQRWLTLVVLVFIAQVAIIFALQKEKIPPMLARARVPQLTLADSSSELIALDDPTLFALPPANGSASKVYPIPPPDFRWTEPPGELLSPAAENLGAVFMRFMHTNQFAAFSLDFKPEPKLSEPVLPLLPAFADDSTLQIEGELAQRTRLSPVSLPSWPYAAAIAPSRVQVLVDPAGDVVSAVLLPSDNPEVAASRYNTADQRALELARAARFSPSSQLTIGRLIFDWRTVAPPATNSTATP
jgi:hypothetical protein